MDIASAGAVDRRTFLKASLVAGVAVIVRPLAATAQSATCCRTCKQLACGRGLGRSLCPLQGAAANPYAGRSAVNMAAAGPESEERAGNVITRRMISLRAGEQREL